MIYRCSNAKKGPHAAYNAYKQFVQIDTTALFLAAAMEHFHLDDVTGLYLLHCVERIKIKESNITFSWHKVQCMNTIFIYIFLFCFLTATPDGLVPDHIQQGSAEQKRTWLHDSVAEVVDKFLMSTDIADLTAGVTEAATAQRTEKEKLPCREPGCKKVFIYRKARETHEEKVHSFVVASMPVVEPASSGLIDHKKQHTEARLSFGFLLFDMLDAVKEGDGERLIRLYKVALLIYKAYGHTNYAYSTFLLTVQINATMSPRVKHDVTWNRFWNSSGGKGKIFLLICTSSTSTTS